MQPVSMTSWNDAIQASQPLVLDLVYPITAAKTVTAIPGTLAFFDALSTQSQIDTFLGTTNEFLLAAFDATAMGTDAFASIIAMNGQAKSVVKCDAYLYSATATVDEKHPLAVSALTSSSLTTQIAKGADGNIAIRVILTGVDAATSGHIHLQIQYFSK